MQPGQVSPLQIVMVQSTTFCNIDCSYCYLPHRQKKGRFDLGRLPVLLEKLVRSGLVGERLTLVWHAGEPLVLPPDYYREAFAITRAALGPKVALTHSFQTNATLVTPEYCELFKLPGVQVGVSIDGPATVHDLFRVTRAGAGTHAQAMKGIAMLRAERIPFTTISVVTAKSLPHADAIFDFLVSLGPTEIGFNVDELEGENTSSSLGAADAPQRYAAFMSTILARALATPNAPRVREFVNAFNAVQGSIFGGSTGSTESNPLSILSVGIDGRLTTYSPELLDTVHPRLGDLAFGTIEDVDFSALYGNPRFAAVNDEVEAGVAECRRSCGYFDVCGGGAPSNKLAENGSFATAETMYCRLRTQAMVDLAHDFVAGRLQASKQRRVRPGAATAA